MPAAPPSRPGGSIPSRLLQPVLLLAVMWAARIMDDLLPYDANRELGIQSWAWEGLDGILVSPVLHGSWAHLGANTVPFLALGVLVALDGAGRFWGVTAVIAVFGGLGVWLVSPPGTITVGASGLVFGYFGYLLVRAFVAPSLGHGILYALLAIGVAAVYGTSMLAGIIDAGAGVSWQAHLFGGIGGAYAAVLLRPRRIRRAPAPPG
ncbi:rhomboid family intramembrane serine protease [Microbacterium sp. ZXX196]|uniref:rhomboid family intramembrane serine protease n=1 Tax=Microbacterium sp. ZXX196 TaxID=2609291 RepID=UPI0012B769E2|nr:rhomboid family intramembrane serine protease [Microbacterium sp. ZXX196]MTE22676.1 rhomboid family intramembrane serine protease [Microbacterium sp. ZXX196]